MNTTDVAHEQFIRQFFDEKDLILYRPIETWVENGKKHSKVYYDGIEYLTPEILIKRWKMLKETARRRRLNAFFGVCPREGRHHDFAWQVRKVNCLWADLDGCTPSEAMARIDEAGLPKPTASVSSGHGLHPYWKLEQPYLIDDASKPPAIQRFSKEIDGKKRWLSFYVLDGERFDLHHPDTGRPIKDNIPELSSKAQYIQDVVAGIAASIGGDHTIDLSRILRLPGTFNRKNERNDQNPVPASVWSFNPGLGYDIGDFDKFANVSPNKIEREKIAQIPLPPVRARHPHRTKERLKELITDCAVADPGTRSETDYALLAYAIEQGIDPDEVWEQVQGVGKFVETERFKSGRDYFEYSWAKAAAKVRHKEYDVAQQRIQTRAAVEEAEQAAAQEDEKADPRPVDGQQDELSKELFRLLGIVVIGERGQEIEVWSRSSKKYLRIRDIDRLGFSRLIQICGSRVVKKHVSEQEQQHGKYSMPLVRHAIADAAMRAEQLDADSKRGPGCWPTDDGRIFLVGRREMAIWNGDLQRSMEPIHEGILYNMAGSTGWYDHKRLATALNSQKLNEVALRKSMNLLRRWRWEFKMGPEITVGLVMASWIQKIWFWRPQVFVSGGADSGKSVFFMMIKQLFCGLGQKASQNTTAIGIIKKCRSSSYVAILDELDKNRHREDIYETVVRPAGRGDDERWTGHGRDGLVESALNQIFWLGGIESGVQTRTDADRIIRLELLPRAKGTKKMVQPTANECFDAGEALLAASLKYAQKAAELASRLAGLEVDGVSNRVSETYSVPAACYSLLAGIDPDECHRDFLLNSFALSENIVADEEELFEAIRGAHVDAGTKLGRLSVEQLVKIADSQSTSPNERIDAESSLEKCGILMKSDTGEVWLNTTQVTRHILKGTKFAKQSLSEFFQRMDFLKPHRNKKKRYWRMPIEKFFMEEIEEEDDHGF